MRSVLRAVVAMLVLQFTACGAVSRFTHASGLEVITIALDSTNVHVVRQGASAFLVDSGYEANSERLEVALREAGVDPSQVKAVVVTHGHADHAGGARALHQRFGVPVIVGRGDEGMFETGKNEPLCPVGVIAGLRHRGDEDARYTGSQADHLVDDTLSLQALTGIDATVVRVPGHTRGSVIVVAGDALLVGDLLRGSIVGSGAETHFFMCDVAQNRRDVLRVLDATAPNAQRVFTGHFGPVSPASVRAHFAAD